MQNTSTLQILPFFKSVEQSAYTIIRGGETQLDKCYKGIDIDIFCYSPADFGAKILAYFNSLQLDKEWTLQVNELFDNQFHFDFCHNKELIFRFDLYGTFPDYTKVCIRPSLFESTIENSRVIELPKGTGAILIKIPSKIDDLLLRYIEYVQYYELRPDKIKHLEYIEAKIEEPDVGTQAFLEKLHHYTDLPKCTPYYPPHATSKGLPAEALSTNKLLKLLWRRLQGKVIRIK